MKKCIALLVAVLLLLTGCAGSVEETVPTTTAAPTTLPTETTVPAKTRDQMVIYISMPSEADPKWNAAGAALLGKFAELGRLADQDAASPAVQAWVKELQQFITDNFYTCTKEILAGLGQMYTCDERFAKNIDKAGGTGTARLASDAIAIYCKQ